MRNISEISTAARQFDPAVLARYENSAPPVIELSDIHKVYQTGDVEFHALRGISLSVREGEFVAIMGTSGSGKSTTMNIIGCLDRPTSGSYVLDGVDVSALSKDERADIRNLKIGFVFQTFNLLHGFSAAQNVMAALMFSQIAGAEHRSRAENLLSQLGITQPDADPDRMLAGVALLLGVIQSSSPDFAHGACRRCPPPALWTGAAPRRRVFIEAPCAAKGGNISPKDSTGFGASP